MDVLMPQLGETVAEGKITRWFKAVGEAVARGDNLCEIETDKVTVEVPAITDGVLTAINAEVGTVAPVGAVIAIVVRSFRRTERTRQRAGPSPPRRPPAPAPRAALDVHQRCQPPPASARRQLDPFREVDTPRAEFRPGDARERHRRDAACETPRRRRVARSRPADRVRVRADGSPGATSRRRLPRASGCPGTRAAERSASPIGDLYRRRPHKVVADRRNAPHHRRAPHAVEGDHPAFLSHRAHRDRPPRARPRGDQRERAEGRRRARRPTSSRSTIS